MLRTTRRSSLLKCFACALVPPGNLALRSHRNLKTTHTGARLLCLLCPLCPLRLLCLFYLFSLLCLRVCALTGTRASSSMEVARTTAPPPPPMSVRSGSHLCSRAFSRLSSSVFCPLQPSNRSNSFSWPSHVPPLSATHGGIPGRDRATRGAGHGGLRARRGPLPEAGLPSAEGRGGGGQGGPGAG